MRDHDHRDESKAVTRNKIGSRSEEHFIIDHKLTQKTTRNELKFSVESMDLCRKAGEVPVFILVMVTLKVIRVFRLFCII